MNANVSNVALYQLSYDKMKTYLVASLFVVGNILLPQLCHLVPKGGLILLPIYFFTLVGAYKYGFTVGLATAVLSPLVNNILFGMPPTPALTIILIKSSILAVAAAWIAQRTHRVTLLNIALAVLAYQAVGTLVEWGMTGSFHKALQDILIGWPGIAIQIVGGYLILRYLMKK